MSDFLTIPAVGVALLLAAVVIVWVARTIFAHRKTDDAQSNHALHTAAAPARKSWNMGGIRQLFTEVVDRRGRKQELQNENSLKQKKPAARNAAKPRM